MTPAVQCRLLPYTRLQLQLSRGHRFCSASVNIMMSRTTYTKHSFIYMALQSLHLPPVILKLNGFLAHATPSISCPVSIGNHLPVSNTTIRWKRTVYELFTAQFVYSRSGFLCSYWKISLAATIAHATNFFDFPEIQYSEWYATFVCLDFSSCVRRVLFLHPPSSTGTSPYSIRRYMLFYCY